jgi:hypothetical protein
VVGGVAQLARLALSGVLRGRLDISRNVDGAAVVLACIDLGEEEGRASVHAVGATISERFRPPPISGDDVFELRELRALRTSSGCRVPRARFAPSSSAPPG